MRLQGYLPVTYRASYPIPYTPLPSPRLGGYWASGTLPPPPPTFLGDTHACQPTGSAAPRPRLAALEPRPQSPSQTPKPQAGEGEAEQISGHQAARVNGPQRMFRPARELSSARILMARGGVRGPRHLEKD